MTLQASVSASFQRQNSQSSGPSLILIRGASIAEYPVGQCPVVVSVKMLGILVDRRSEVADGRAVVLFLKMDAAPIVQGACVVALVADDKGIVLDGPVVVPVQEIGQAA